MIATLHLKGTTEQVHARDWLSKFNGLELQGVIFDCDGTLVDSAQAHCQAMQAAAIDQGCEMAADWYMARTGLNRLGLFEAFRDRFNPNFDVPRAVSISISNYNRHLNRIHPIRQTSALLRVLKSQKIPIAVATNSEQEIARQTLTSTGLFKDIDVLVSISDKVEPKPAPALFQLAAEKLQLRHNQVVVFEDSKQGVDAALNAQMPVFELP
ncbi:MAG: HAD family phosphatase [Roseobacter sp.]